MPERRLTQSMQTSARQELQLLPQMLQSIEILALPAGELEAYLRAAAEENELLRVEARPPAPPRGRGTLDDAYDWLAERPARAGGPAEHVAQELALAELDPLLVPWVRLVADHLEPSGLLAVIDEALLVEAGARALAGGVTELGRAIAAVQGLEPRGIGARTAVEALLLQLDPREPDYALLCRLLEEFVEDLARNKLPQVAECLGVELAHLCELLGRLRELDPAPLSRVAGDAAPPLTPEVLLVPSATGFEVHIDQSGLPAVTIEPRLAALVRDRAQTGEVRGYLRERLARARWLLVALEQRKRTLQRVATAVFARQGAFLENGRGHLRPLTMTEVAEELALSVSTVSRAVADKHADTPWGILPLRHFFQPSSGGDEQSLADVRGIVRSIVAAEPPDEPLSDGAIADELERRGIRAARRTVAKHRSDLGIPSSYRRRRFGPADPARGTEP
jgi:RNA polymerase sigma-54 factor